MRKNKILPYVKYLFCNILSDFNFQLILNYNRKFYIFLFEKLDNKSI